MTRIKKVLSAIVYAIKKSEPQSWAQRLSSAIVYAIKKIAKTLVINFY